MNSELVVIRTCNGLDELRACVALQNEVWNFTDEVLVPLRMFVVAEKVGGQVMGAFAGNEMVGFALSPDRKLGYSLMVYSTGANRVTEWWVWDLAARKVIKRESLPARINFRFSITSDGSKLLVYGGGSTIEFYDTKTLKSTKLLYLNKDTTTNLITLPAST